MKRTLIILFAGFFLALSVGVSLNLHYCAGKLAKVRIMLPTPKCCCGDSGMERGCCDDEQLTVQMDIDQLVVQAPDWKLSLPALVLPSLILSDEAHTFSPKKIISHFPNPPPLLSHDIRIRMGSLTFYG